MKGNLRYDGAENSDVIRLELGAQTALPDAWCLQYPNDYLEVLDEVVPKLLRESGISKEEIIGIGIDFTSCTVLPIDENAVPLCEKPEFRLRRNAYVKLWKHHGAQKQADRINDVIVQMGLEKDLRCGGRISSELLVPKVMETLEEDPQIYHSADEFLEAGDWLTRVLTGSHARSCSMAGYKAWWVQSYPDECFMAAIHPKLAHLAQEKLPGEIVPIGTAVGYLNAEWADRLGLKAGIAVAPTIIDSHAGVPGIGLASERQMALVLGTSSVMIALGKKPYSEKGICGGVKDAIVPGYYALESGLAAVGDLFGWFVENCVPAACAKEAEQKGISVHTLLSEKAEKLAPGESGLLALDWWNGNKTPLVNGNLGGVLLGMTLQTKPEEIYRALIEATAFGTKRIVELYEKSGVVVDEVIASGGITQKNPLLMQIYADVLEKPVRVASCEHTAALGSAIYAAMAAGSKAGGFDSCWTAMEHMSSKKEAFYVPMAENRETYRELYALYCRFGDRMGADGGSVFEALQTIRRS